MNKTIVRNSLNLRNELPTQETFRTANRHTRNYPVHIIVWLRFQIYRTKKPFRQLKENNDKSDVKADPPEQQQISRKEALEVSRARDEVFQDFKT